MTQTSAPLDPTTAGVFDRIDPTIAQNRSDLHSKPSDTNVAPLKKQDGCDSDSSCELPESPPSDADDSSKIEHWKPADPQFCKEIATYYGQSKRTIQKWFVDLREIAPWFSESELRLEDDRYTPLAVELLGERYFAGSKKKWAQTLLDRSADQIETWTAAQSDPALHPDVLPPQDAPTPMNGSNEALWCNRGMVLHFGSDLDLPSIPGLIPITGDAAYLAQMQQRLQTFEQLQQQAIAQMHTQYEQAQALNAQYHEAMSLSDQLLLQEFQLRGVQLGYAALQVKQEAFKATIQAAEAGTLSTPGKPQPETTRSL
ncbi:hypothetical protein H6F51_10470 [Cyanobacteria bacterium FACHB-DQ100]|nr:hypothetical protein [Cyanobacteria bacterium FACHB-DQ100]